MVNGTTHLPFAEIGFTGVPLWTLIQARDELKKRPEVLASGADLILLYHQLLQKAIVDWLREKYPNSWEVDIFPLTLGEARGYMFAGRQVVSRTLSSEELAKKMVENPFAELNGPFGALGIAVPPQTDFDIIPPHQDSKVGQVGTIVLTNSYCTISVETRQASWMRGIGTYRFLLGLTEDQANALETYQYLVIVDVIFARFRTGSPKMPKYKKWADDIMNGLEAQFDEQSVYSKSRDWQILERTLRR